MLPELLILLNLAANSTDVKLAEDLYASREPQAEYFYYSAADTDSQTNSGGQSLIDYNKLKVNFEVTVNYLDVIASITRSNVNAINASKGDSWQMVEPLIENKTANEILSMYKSEKGFRLPIESGDDWASYLELFSIPGDPVAGFFFSFEELNGNQVTIVKGYAKDSAITVGDVYAHWQTLVDTYRRLPLQRFEGASYY